LDALEESTGSGSRSTPDCRFRISGPVKPPAACTLKTDGLDSVSPLRLHPGRLRKVPSMRGAASQAGRPPLAAEGRQFADSAALAQRPLAHANRLGGWNPPAARRPRDPSPQTFAGGGL